MSNLVRRVVDLNVDVGEGLDNENLIMPHISSCNIACGGHAGNAVTMQKVVDLACCYNVKIGAHPAFPDKVNFGRLNMAMPAKDLYLSLKKQVAALQMVVFNKKAVLNHVKPHGALYNLAAINPGIAQVVIDVVKSLNSSVKLYVPYNSVIAKLAIAQQIPICYEAFADRRYNEDYTLVSRTNKKALITKSELMFNHVYNMIIKKQLVTINGVTVGIEADTFCLHGDTLNAPVLIKTLKERLETYGVFLK